jgi:hypothetical protein
MPEKKVEEKEEKPYQDLLEEIIKGEIPNPIDIRKKYEEIGEELERKRNGWKI